MDQQLISFIQQNETTNVKRLLASGGNPNARDSVTGMTGLLIAACQANPEMVKVLLEAGADLFAVDSRAGASVLHKACQGGSLEVVRLLIEAGAFVDWIAPTTGHTPLMDAIWFKWPTIVEYLLERNAGLGITTHYGFTLAQHLKYEEGVTETAKQSLQQIRRMVEKRQQTDQEREKTQKLMAAVTSGYLCAVAELLASGAIVDERFPVLSGFNDAHTPLLVACRDGHTGIAKALLDAGADVNAVEPTFGAVPLHKAVYNGHADIVSLLVAAPKVNLDFQGYTNGYTPLHDALWHGFADCAQILIAAGAKLDLRGHDGKTPLDIARETLGPDHALSRLIESRLKEK